AVAGGASGSRPPCLAVVFFGAWATRTGDSAGGYDIAAAGIFVVSVGFRAIDPLVCEAMPLGTHFLWHSLNGLMLGVLLAATVRRGALAAAPSGDTGRTGASEGAYIHS